MGRIVQARRPPPPREKSTPSWTGTQTRQRPECLWQVMRAMSSTLPHSPGTPANLAKGQRRAVQAVPVHILVCMAI